MDIAELRTLLDFGMVVILWLVQRVIYPSFLTCDDSRLVEWHQAYTCRAGILIGPILFTQLPLVGWLTWTDPSVGNLCALASLFGAWVVTFSVAVPLHKKIASGDLTVETRQKLVRTNWPRTILWTAAFLFGLS